MTSRSTAFTTHTAKNAAAAAMTVALGVGLASVPSTSAWGGTDVEGASSSAPEMRTGESAASRVAQRRATPTYATYVKRADAALAAATQHLKADHPVRSNRVLERLTINLRRAHVQATAQIGKPPVDPESDDPPGPPAVNAVVGLDHRIGVNLVPMVDGLRRPVVTEKLRVALWSADNRRDAILVKVIALPPEGDGDEYADGLADTLPRYGQEVSQLTTALASYQLTPAGTNVLHGALDRVKTTQRRMEAAFGGGERSPSTRQS